MFNLISTKNLWLIEISFIDKIDWHGIDYFIQYYSKEKRYTLAKKLESGDYLCVFTHHILKSASDQFDSKTECVTSSEIIITSKKFITKEEGINIVQKLNPTYLPENPKILKKSYKNKRNYKWKK